MSNVFPHPNEVRLPDWVNPGLLTHPNIPPPLHQVNPRSILGSSWWDKNRRIAYKEHDFHCWACGVKKTQIQIDKRQLEAHEIYDIDYARGKVRFEGLCALCPTCHRFIHSGRLFALWEKHEISSASALRTLMHGFKVLDRCNRERGTKFRPFWFTLVFGYMLTGPHSYDTAFKIVDGKGMIDYAEGPPVPWAEWRLILNEKEYPPKFASEAEWEKHFGRSSFSGKRHDRQFDT